MRILSGLGAVALGILISISSVNRATAISLEIGELDIQFCSRIIFSSTEAPEIFLLGNNARISAIGRIRLDAMNRMRVVRNILGEFHEGSILESSIGYAVLVRLDIEIKCWSALHRKLVELRNKKPLQNIDRPFPGNGLFRQEDIKILLNLLGLSKNFVAELRTKPIPADVSDRQEITNLIDEFIRLKARNSLTIEEYQRYLDVVADLEGRSMLVGLKNTRPHDPNHRGVAIQREKSEKTTNKAKTTQGAGNPVQSVLGGLIYDPFIEVGFGWGPFNNDPALDPFNQFIVLGEGFVGDIYVGTTYDTDGPIKFGGGLKIFHDQVENDLLGNVNLPGVLNTTGKSKTTGILPTVFAAFPLFGDISARGGAGFGGARRVFDLQAPAGNTVASANGFTWVAQGFVGIWGPVPALETGNTTVCWGLEAQWTGVGNIDGQLPNTSIRFKLGPQHSLSIMARVRFKFESDDGVRTIENEIAQRAADNQPTFEPNSQKCF